MYCDFFANMVKLNNHTFNIMETYFRFLVNRFTMLYYYVSLFRRNIYE